MLDFDWTFPSKVMWILKIRKCMGMMLKVLCIFAHTQNSTLRHKGGYACTVTCVKQTNLFKVYS